MANPYLVGLLAGVLSGALSAFAVLGAPVAKFLIYLAPLPCFIAGFGWRLNASLTATLSGTFLLMALAGTQAGFGFFLSIGAPSLILTYLAHLSRDDAILSSDAPGHNPSAKQSAVEWYPVGNLLFWAAIMAGALSVFVIFSLGSDIESYRAAVKEIFEKTLLKQLEILSGQPISPSDASSIGEVVVAILPGASALSWLALTLFNMWLGARIALATGRLQRPWPHLPLINYPNNLSLVFIGAIILTMISGITQLIGIAFLSAFLLLFILLGFAVLHSITQGNPFRPLMLTFAYIVFIFIGQYGILVMATIGLAEPVFKIRQRLTRPPPTGGT